MFDFLKINYRILTKAEQVPTVDKILLPGVGSFDNAVTKLASLGFDCEILIHNDKNKAILGICLGMQLLTNRSQEGILNGLSIIDANCRKISNGKVVPNMGWRDVEIKKDCLIKGSNQRFYHVHSYHVTEINNDFISCTTRYGDELVTGFESNNVFGYQFHPEKSHAFGLRFFREFDKL